MSPLANNFVDGKAPFTNSEGKIDLGRDDQRSITCPATPTIRVGGPGAFRSYSDSPNSPTITVQTEMSNGPMPTIGVLPAVPALAVTSPEQLAKSASTLEEENDTVGSLPGQDPIPALPKFNTGSNALLAPSNTGATRYSSRVTKASCAKISVVLARIDQEGESDDGTNMSNGSGAGRSPPGVPGPGQPMFSQNRIGVKKEMSSANVRQQQPRSGDLR